jgi:hypothetical protein
VTKSDRAREQSRYLVATTSIARGREARRRARSRSIAPRADDPATFVPIASPRADGAAADRDPAAGGIFHQASRADGTHMSLLPIAARIPVS